MLLDQQFRAQNAGYRATYPNARFDVIETHDGPIGRIISDRSDDALTLIDIAVTNEARGRGVATALIRDLCREAAVLELPVRLRVTGSKGGARQLYEHLGFTVVATDAVGFAMEWRNLESPPSLA